MYIYKYIYIYIYIYMFTLEQKKVIFALVQSIRVYDLSLNLSIIIPHIHIDILYDHSTHTYRHPTTSSTPNTHELELTHALSLILHASSTRLSHAFASGRRIIALDWSFANSALDATTHCMHRHLHLRPSY